MSTPPDFLSALLAIVLIDLVLAGDNAIIIGIAARNVSKDRQRMVILWGTVGAITVRVVLTGAVVWLLKVPGLRLIVELAEKPERSSVLLAPMSQIVMIGVMFFVKSKNISVGP